MNGLQMQIENLSLISPDRRKFISDALVMTSLLAGLNAEVGVYRGGTALLIASESPKEFHCFDTFEGLPEARVWEHHTKGEFAASFEEARDLLAPWPHAFVHKGKFPECLADDKTRKGWFIQHAFKYAFVHLDVDLYDSTLECLKFFYPRMEPNGILVTDDYRWRDTPGVTKAFDEFFEGKPEPIRMATQGQAFVVKK
jgi:O-methyltransferase